MLNLALILISISVAAGAYMLGRFLGYSAGYDAANFNKLASWREGFDTGKIEGLEEGWKHWPERDSRGRYKAKETV